jgi:hypothetical protein
MFADDFTPSLMVRANLLYENNCAILSGTETLFGATTFTHEKRFVCQDRLWTRASEKFEKGWGVFPSWAGNCANFMMKSVNISAIDNVVADSNYTGVVSKTNNNLARPFSPLCAENLSLSS